MNNKKCKRCNSEWQSRIEAEPIQCPRCKSPFWNKERVREVAK